jgi:hypothetical protein
MEDGRKNNGGNKSAGRKPKAEEEKVRKLGIDAIIKVYGSVAKYYQHIATESKESFPHLKLLQEYVYGKPKETIENTNINYNQELTKEDVKLINDELENKY